MSAAAVPPVLLSARGLHTYYGDSHVLHGVDLDVALGETVCLMGRNGMGKTTTLRSILGLTRPRRGAVAIMGRDMTGAAPHRIVREGIGYVPEGRGIFPLLSVREHLVMAARPGRGGRRDWSAERVLALFPRLAERIANSGATLSGGEQQMLAIGRALMSNPDLLILDEATEGLAPLVRREIWAVLRQIKATGMATIIVDKNAADLLGFADRAVILVKGRVAFDGTCAALRAQPALIERHIGL
jgi:branched-chain amino acid transport system ATP-binding protein